MIQQINSIYDVIAFIELIADEIKDCNPFEELSRYHRYTAEEAAYRNDLMEQCFQICAAQNQNFKCLAQVLFNEAVTGQATSQVPA